MTTEFDGMVVPLLRRMTYLEKLLLSIRTALRDSIIDGTYLSNYILCQMPRLHTFHFDILNEFVQLDLLQPVPTRDGIRRTFTERGYDADCYLDYKWNRVNRCHVYSLPFHMDRVGQITSGFLGGTFLNVRAVYLKDFSRPFEHNFFGVISRSFPSLSRLKVVNLEEQKEKNEDKLSIIEFPHLVKLDCVGVHIDYAEQFLSDLNTRLPCLTSLFISYKNLARVTENFTRNATRGNCTKLTYIGLLGRSKPMVYPKDYDRYFPLLL